jgi:hypothetical protein
VLKTVAPSLGVQRRDNWDCSRDSHVRIDGYAFVGKESNLLEEVEAGTVQDAQKRLRLVSRSATR